MISVKTRSVIALDAGGTHIKAGIFSEGRISQHTSFNTERELGPEHAINQILKAAAAMQKLHPEASAVGLVVPGVVDAAKGVAVYSENILWRDVKFVELLSETTGLPSVLNHDVRAGGLAEAHYGSGIGAKDFFFMPIGTGIAGAIVLNGEVYENPFAGEIGHFNVNSGYKCACGLSGCLESNATSPSIARIYSEFSGSKVNGSKEVVDKFLEGDEDAIKTWKIAVTALATALGAYATMMAPSLIILGGGVSQAGELLLAPLREQITSMLTFQPVPRIVISSLGNYAGMIGAGVLASRITNK
jgi:glucokinase